MWTASIDITDNDGNMKGNVIYKFKKLFKYEDLYNELPKMLKSLGYSKLKYKKSEVKFEFSYLNQKCFVDDWKKYVLNLDNIYVTLERQPNVYRLINSMDKTIITSSLEIKKLYNFYFNNKFKYPILLYCEEKLIDVLDNPNNYLNACVKSLMKYGY